MAKTGFLACSMTLRVIGGKYGSRRLVALRGLALRPTSDRLRETLFDILGPAVEDSVFVDVYAGSGAVGIEALSRGARHVIFIERHTAALTLLRRNLHSLGIETGVVQLGSPQVEILASDGLRGLALLARRRASARVGEAHARRGFPGLADFFFLDPPYAEEKEYERALEFLDESPMLSPSGRVIVEHRRGLELPERLEVLERVRVAEQGDAALSFYRLVRAA